MGGELEIVFRYEYNVLHYPFIFVLHTSIICSQDKVSALLPKIARVRKLSLWKSLLLSFRYLSAETMLNHPSLKILP